VRIKTDFCGLSATFFDFHGLKSAFGGWILKTNGQIRKHKSQLTDLLIEVVALICVPPKAG
jgi:hypothetical protein